MSEETRPLGGLPGADRTLLAHAPLELAIAEFRLTPGQAGSSPDLVFRFKERLADLGLSLSRIEPMQQQRLSLNVQAGVVATAPQLEAASSGWLLVSADGTTQVTLLPEAVVYQTSRYHRWSVTMRPPIEAILLAISEIQAPALVVRIGVRYVNRFVDPTAAAAADWKDRINEHFLGPLCHPDIGTHVKASQQQVELTFSDIQGALLRHGPFLDVTSGGSVSYLVDIDVFDSEPMRFNPAQMIERTEVLNRTAATLFQGILTAEFLHALQETDSTEKIVEASPR